MPLLGCIARRALCFFPVLKADSTPGAIPEAACGQRFSAQPVDNGVVQTNLRAKRSVHRGDHDCSGGYHDRGFHSVQLRKGDTKCESFDDGFTCLHNSQYNNISRRPTQS